MIKRKENIDYFDNGNVYINNIVLYDTEHESFFKFNGVLQRYLVNGERAYIIIFKQDAECGAKINFEYEKEVQWWDD